MPLQFRWTDGNNPDFHRFWFITEQYYDRVAGGRKSREQYVPYNLSTAVEHALLVYDDETPVACAGLKRYSGKDVEIKRVWVEPEWRNRRIATLMMAQIEEKAKTLGYSRMILQTREIMQDAVGLYTRLGYHLIDNYPPYDTLDGAICFAKVL